MGVLLGNSRSLQSPLSQSAASPVSVRSLSPSPRRRAVRKSLAMASLHEKDRTGSSHRRAFLIVGASVLPFLQLRAVIAEGLLNGGRRRNLLQNRISEAANNREKEKEGESIEPSKTNIEDIGKTDEQDPEQPEQKISSEEPSELEQVHIQNAPENPFLSLLNEIGIIGSGLLGALYATSRREKIAMESTVESVKAELAEKEAATTLLKENFETRLLYERGETKKQAKRLEEAETLSSNQLASANATIADLSQVLKNEKKLAEELKVNINQLEHGMVKAVKEREMLETGLKEKMDTINVLQDKISLLILEIKDKEKTIETTNLSLAEKESECKNLSSLFDQIKAHLADTNSIVEQLKAEIFEARGEVDSKRSLIEDLNNQVRILQAEKNDADRKLDELIKVYNDLKSSSEKKSAFDAELLSNKDSQIHQFEEKLGIAVNEASVNQAMIAKLVKERDNARSLLEQEVNSMKRLRDELHTTQEKLGDSTLEASNLSKELKEAKGANGELRYRVSKIHEEFQETKKLLTSDIEKGKSTLKVLSDELESVREVLNSTREELGATSNELEVVTVDNESLKKELLDIYDNVEATTNELREERRVVAALNRDLEAVKKQLLFDLEARKVLEADLDEATKSLDEMNKSVLFLSKELESMNLKSSSLETEKEMLFKSLVEQKNAAKEALENVEDAQNLITSLGSEREKLEKRSKKLEEELAAAKGEILRLRRRIVMSKTNDIGDGIGFGLKKTVSKRRKGGSVSEDSF